MKTRFSSKTSEYSLKITLLKEIFQIEICSFLEFLIYSLATYKLKAKRLNYIA